MCQTTPSRGVPLLNRKYVIHKLGIMTCYNQWIKALGFSSPLRLTRDMSRCPSIEDEKRKRKRKRRGAMEQYETVYYNNVVR
jgi:hypothetical protein